MSLNRPVWKLRHWIDEEKLNIYQLGLNSNAIELLKRIKNKDERLIKKMCSNTSPFIIEQLLENEDLIDYKTICYNPNSCINEIYRKKFDKISFSLSMYFINDVRVLRENFDKINWLFLSLNSNYDVIKFLEEHLEKINWSYLCINTSPHIIPIVKKYPQLIDWDCLSYNENAIEFLTRKENIQYLNLNRFSLNPKSISFLSKPENNHMIRWNYIYSNPNITIELIELGKKCSNTYPINWRDISLHSTNINVLRTYKDKLDWSLLSKNPDAIKLLEKQRDKIDYFGISSNPSIFQLDYEAMRIANQAFEEELVKEVMKPSRVFKYHDHNYDYLEELFGD